MVGRPLSQRTLTIGAWSEPIVRKTTQTTDTSTNPLTPNRRVATSTDSAATAPVYSAAAAAGVVGTPQPWRSLRSRYLLLVFATIFLARVGLLSAIVPMWQGPDEPEHVFFVAALVDGSPSDVDPIENPKIEREVVQSMWRSGWWEHYGRSRPAQLPTRFVDGPAQIADLTGRPHGPTFYYRSMAAAARSFGCTTLASQYSLMRAISIVSALLTLFVCWHAAGQLLDEDHATMLAGALAFHPKFAVVAVLTGPDAVMNLLGAVSWACLAIAFARRHPIVWVPLALASAGTSLFIKRTGAPLLASVVLAVLYLLVVRSWRRGGPGRLIVTAAMLACGAMVWRVLTSGQELPIEYIGTPQGGADSTALFWWVRHALGWASTWRDLIVVPISVIWKDPAFFGQYVTVLFKTFWIAAGWLRYWASDSVYWAWLIVAVVGLGGTLGRAVKDKGRYRDTIVMCLVFVVIHVIAGMLIYLPVRIGAQGRYLFTATGPILLLMTSGLLSIVPPAHRPRAVGAILALFACFDAMAWATVLLPAYALR